MKPAAKSAGKSTFDLATLGGLLLAFGGILGGLIMEGGRVRDVSQVSAAVIVFLGTIGAVMVTTPMGVLARAAKKLPQILFYRSSDATPVVEEIIRYAAKARKEGIVSLEADADAAPDPFLRKALTLAVDGVDLEQIRKIMDLEIIMEMHEGEAEAKVFESAGGYAPTIGIIGAVLGLIQVMKNLANIDEVGRGIAVAFVATVYGVGSANIFFLPTANKLKARMQASVRIKELMLEGVMAIVEGMHPKLIQSKLEGYLRDAQPAKKKKGAEAPAPAPARAEA